MEQRLKKQALVPYHPRKYIDLIKNADGRWATWDPSLNAPAVGDFGEIDRKTGQLIRQGNVYEAPFHIHSRPSTKPSVGARQAEIRITSRGVTEVADVAAGSDLDPVKIASASVKGTWEFGQQRGAVLVLAEPRTTSLPSSVMKSLLGTLSTSKWLVSEVVKCSAYALYLSDEGHEKVTLALTTGTSGSSWITSKSGDGILKHGGHPGGKDEFTALFTLKKAPEEWYREYGMAYDDPVDENGWADPDTPWKTLGEGGKELGE